MAKVIPYACATAHGQLNRTLCFRRRGEKVVLGKIPRPVYTNSAGQQTNRIKFREGVQRYQLMNFDEKNFLRKRATQLPGNSYALWQSKYMNNRIWSHDKPIGIASISNMVIQDPAGEEINNALISIEAVATSLQDIDCLFWNRLGSNYQVDNSEIGDGGIRVGIIQYAPGEFDLGVYNTTPSNYIIFPDVHALNKGIIEAWWVPYFSSTDQSFGVADFWTINRVPAQESFLVAWNANYWTPKNTFFLYGDDNGVKCQYAFTPVPFSPGQKIHLEIIVDYSQGPGERYKILQDGADLPIAQIYIDNPLSFTGIGVELITLWSLQGSQAVIDNLKLYPETKWKNIIYQNSDYENFDPDPIPIEIYGTVQENNNEFIPGSTIDDAPAQRIVIINTGGYDLHIPFRYSVAVTWSGPGITDRTSVVRFPEMTVDVGETKVLYLSEDWSVYYDKKLIHLACTNKM